MEIEGVDCFFVEDGFGFLDAGVYVNIPAFNVLEFVLGGWGVCGILG